MSTKAKKFLLYITAVIVFSLMGFAIYDVLQLHLFHMEKVSVFCDKDTENVGIKDTRSLGALKAYVADPGKFESMGEFERNNFFADTLHLPECSKGMLFSKRYNGARSVMVEFNDEDLVLTVLTNQIRFDER